MAQRSIGAVVLAAGVSTRLGTPKQFIPFRGRNFLARAVDNLPPGAGWVENPRWSEGMSTSIRTGLMALVEAEPTVPAALLMVCDQPYVLSLLRRMAAAYRRTGAPIVACAYGGAWGVAALFERTLFPELQALTGDRGAQSVIGRYLDRVVQIPFPRGAVDIDTPEDWARLRRCGTCRPSGCPSP
jgi:molybdenum cofactor cytidylyltransferase